MRSPEPLPAAAGNRHASRASDELEELIDSIIGLGRHDEGNTPWTMSDAWVTENCQTLKFKSLGFERG